MVEVLLLAGSSGSSELTENEKVFNKAFIKINGEPLLSYILKALKKCPEIDRTVIVGPAEELRPIGEKFQAEIVQEKGSIAQNILVGTRAVTAGCYMLLVTADIPLLTKEAVEDFLDRCRPFEKADFYYPVIAKDVNEEKFPGVQKTYVPLKEGAFTGGNIMLINAARVEEGIPRVEKFIKARKSPLKLIRLLGSRFLIRFAARRLTIKDLEESFSQLLQLNSKAVISPYPEIGTDIDKACDLELVRRAMA